MPRFHSDENWELSIDPIRSDLTNAQFPIPNSHPNGKLGEGGEFALRLGSS